MYVVKFMNIYLLGLLSFAASAGLEVEVVAESAVHIIFGPN